MMFLLRKACGTSLVDRKSTRLNSSHLGISYAVFCLKKKHTAVAHHARHRHRLLRLCGGALGARRVPPWPLPRRVAVTRWWLVVFLVFFFFFEGAAPAPLPPFPPPRRPPA